MKNSSQEIKSQLSISTLLKHYGGECTNQSSGAWWCLIHEAGGKNSGHKTPSLVAKDSTGTATCMSQNCFESDDIFGVIAKMENLDIRNDFTEVKKMACELAGISTDFHIETPQIETKKDNLKPITQIEELQTNHIKYLESIGISKETAEFFNLKSRYDYILHPQIENDEVIGYKGISITKDKETGKSKMFFEGEKTSVWGNLNQNKHLIFVEGEKDCLRLFEEITRLNKQDKYSVLTITTGAKTVPSNIVDTIKKVNPQSISIIYDNDSAGIEGSKKLANALIEEVKTVNIYSFNQENKEGYDVSDFLNEGGKLSDLWNLEKEELSKQTEEDKKYKQFIIPVSTEELKAEINKSSNLITTGYKIQGEELSIPPSAISIFVAPTSHGKTMIQANLAVNMAQLHKKSSVYFFSYEEQRCDILLKMLNCYVGVKLSENNFRTIKQEFIGNTEYIKSSILNSRDYEEGYLGKKKEFFDTLINTNRLSIHYVEQSVEELTKTIEYLSKNTNIGAVVIDYIQLLYSEEKRLSRQEELKIICHKLKSCAIKTGLPIILGSQFNRQVVSANELISTNIGEAGDIERIAGLVVGMWNNNFNQADKENTLLLRILKNRNGKAGLEETFNVDGNLTRVVQNEDKGQSYNTRYEF